MNIGLAIIGWFLVLTMSVGIFAIKISEMQLRLDDEGIEKLDKFERLTAETFLQMYWDSDFKGKVSFVLINGAILISMVFFGRD